MSLTAEAGRPRSRRQMVMTGLHASAIGCAEGLPTERGWRYQLRAHGRHAATHGSGTPFGLSKPRSILSEGSAGAPNAPRRAARSPDNRVVINWRAPRQHGPAARPMSESASTCPFCSTPLAPDQRYCLNCGARVAAHRVTWPRAVAAPAGPTVVPATAARSRRPSPRTAAALVLTTLGVGTMLGSAATGATQAGTPPPIVAFAPAATAGGTPTPAPAPSGAGLADDNAPRRPRRSPPLRPSPRPWLPLPLPRRRRRPQRWSRPHRRPRPRPPRPRPRRCLTARPRSTSSSSRSPATTAPPSLDSLSPYLAHQLPKEGGCSAATGPPAPGTFAKELSALAGELGDAARSWKAYVDEPAPCSADPAPGYAPRAQPFPRPPGLADAEGPLVDLEADFADTDLAPRLALVVPGTLQ